VLILLVGAFVGAVVYTWDMPPPLRKIEKILPPAIFEGENIPRITQ
jgi:hypothetical protein